MGKSDFSKFFDKLKTDTSETVDKVKDKAGDFFKAVQKKVGKQEKSTEAIPILDEGGSSSQLEEQTKDKVVKITLDDALLMAVDQYNDAYTTMNDNGVTLYRERLRAVDLITHVETLISSIANRPKDFDTDITEIKTQRESFTDIGEFAKAELEAAKKSALGAGAGVATGAAIVSVAPTVALWVASTFGVASTGTAISALSGAAATNAALAWLGGGALAAGGGGMVAGQAFLALAGPVGWGIAGVTLLSSIVLFKLNKRKLNKKKNEEIEQVKNNTNTTRKIAAQIQELLDEVVLLHGNLSQQYSNCLASYGEDFMSIPREQQMQLGALVNNTKALAASLSHTIQ